MTLLFYSHLDFTIQILYTFEKIYMYKYIIDYIKYNVKCIKNTQSLKKKLSNIFVNLSI